MTTLQPQPGWYPDPSGAPGLRWFNGEQWTNDPPVWTNAPTEEANYPLSMEERVAILDDKVAHVIAHARPRGWRVESRSPTQAVLVFGNNANGGIHVIHFILTLLTCGLWGFVWILYGMSRHEDRETLTVDPFGEVTRG